MDDSITKQNGRPDRLFKAIVGICLIFIAIACTVYSVDTYKRRAHEQKTWDYCIELVSAETQKSRWPEQFAATKEAVIWTAVNKCVRTGEL